MSIWEAFGMGRHKGFSREAGLLLDEAVELAGSMGCARADTGHLLLAMLQTDRGPAGRFLAGKNITEPAVRRQLAEGRTSPARQLDRKALAPDLRRAMDYALIGAQNARLPKAEVFVETMNPAVAKRFKERSIEGSHAKFTWGVKHGRALAALLPGFRLVEEHSLTEGMAVFAPVYKLLDKLPAVRNISNKIIVLEHV